MAIPVILISLDSSEDSMGTPAGRVILFGTIPTTIPDTTPVITPPTTQTDTTDNDTPDTPPSPTHGTPFTETTLSTQRSLTASGAVTPPKIQQCSGIPHGVLLHNTQSSALYPGAPIKCYKTFMASKPKEFYGTKGAVGLLSWLESVESKLSITKCAEGNKTRGREAANGLSWENFKKLLTEEYCRKDQEKRVDHYIWGLVPEIRRMVASSNPITLQAVVGLAYRLTKDLTDLKKP
ncbi:hypothetical protein Tco_0875419 [Tanacetum coccineum]|uniref:Reverse transcriptase domain-containing protein n=1 Tax=Tanacetum coccineum TaxID=301880 RepID=A0ABQ5BSX6_9ASTR